MIALSVQDSLIVILSPGKKSEVTETNKLTIRTTKINFQSLFTEHYAKVTTLPSSESYSNSDCQFNCQFPTPGWGVRLYSFNNYLLSHYCVQNTMHGRWDTIKNKVRSCLPGASGLFRRKRKMSIQLEVHVCQGHREDKMSKPINTYSALGTPESGKCVWVMVVFHFGIWCPFPRAEDTEMENHNHERLSKYGKQKTVAWSSVHQNNQ